MNILLHICCAPCAIYPLETLRSEGFRVTGLFFNHNIHPYQEYRRRLDAAVTYASMASMELVLRDEYRLEEFLSAVASAPGDRCRYCYASRLDRTAGEAAALGYDAFTSSLLYSRYQDHELIREEGERAGCRHGVRFHYRDFRPGWRRGIDVSRELGLYRQQYCGCIYSEMERYRPKSANRTGGAA